jgi:hypothetical protein
MPFVLFDERFDTVIGFMRMQRGGVTLGQIMGRFTPRMERRTAQRMMADLIRLGAVTTTGDARARQYHLRTKPGPFGAVLWVTPGSELAEKVAQATEAAIHRRAVAKQRSAPG